MENFTPSEEKRENWPVIIGFLWAPGLGKTVAMNVVENEENLKDVQDSLWRDRPVKIWVARKTTSRPNRWADDRLKISGVPEEVFEEKKDEFVGEYTLTNNNAKYAYSKAELDQDDKDILVAEPSIWHLSEIKEYLWNRLVVCLIAADTEYRKERMNWRGTEEESQINKRLVEGDVQIFIASKLSGEEGKVLPNLIDPRGLEIYEKIYASNGDEKYLGELRDYIFDLVGEDEFADKSSKEYFNMIVKNTQNGWDLKLFDHIIVRSLEKDEPFETMLVHGFFRDSIIDIVKEHLKK